MQTDAPPSLIFIIMPARSFIFLQISRGRHIRTLEGKPTECMFYFSSCTKVFSRNKGGGYSNQSEVVAGMKHSQITIPTSSVQHGTT